MRRICRIFFYPLIIPIVLILSIDLPRYLVDAGYRKRAVVKQELKICWARR